MKFALTFVICIKPFIRWIAHPEGEEVVYVYEFISKYTNRELR